MVGDEGVVIAKRWKLRVGRRERKNSGYAKVVKGKRKYWEKKEKKNCHVTLSMMQHTHK